MQTTTSAKRSSIAVALGALLMLAMLLSPLMTPGSSLADRITASVRLNGGSPWTPPSPSSNGEIVSGPTGVTIQVEFTLEVTASTWWRGTSYQFEGGRDGLRQPHGRNDQRTTHPDVQHRRASQLGSVRSHPDRAGRRRMQLRHIGPLQDAECRDRLRSPTPDLIRGLRHPCGAGAGRVGLDPGGGRHR